MKLRTVASLLLLKALWGQSPEAWRQIGQELPRSPIAGVFIADPANGSTVYTIAHRLLFKSTDGSGSWTALGGITGVYSLLIDPQHSATLYAGTSHGVLKSLDGGASWAGANAGLPKGWPAWAQVLAIDPVAPSVLYVQKWKGLFKSTNGGRSWEPMNARFYASGSATPISNFEMWKLFIDPIHPSTMYAGPGLYKSTDGGSTWRAVFDGELAGFNPSTSALYAFGRSGKMFKSTDQGTSWTQTGSGFPAGVGAQLVFDPKNAATIYAPYVQVDSSRPAPPAFGLVKSADAGENWTAITAAIPGRFIVSLAVDTNSTVYTSYPSEGTFRSVDGGASWSAAAVPVVVDVPALVIDSAHPNVLYAAAGENGIFRSTDRGAEWTKLSRFQVQTDLFTPHTVEADYLSMDPRNPELLYTGAVCLLYKSADAGADWEKLDATAECGTSGVLALDPHDSNTFYLAQADMVAGGSWIYKTTDGGKRWSRVWVSGDDYVEALAVDPVTPSTIYAGVSRFADSGKGLLKSVDGGASWSEVDIRLGVNVLALDPLHPDVVYAATTTDDYDSEPTAFAGLFKSADAGASWSAINSGLEVLVDTGAPITALTFHPGKPEVLYAATSGNGVFRSMDGGSSWSEFNDGLSNFNVRALAINPGRPGELFASTSGGIFRVSVSAASAPSRKTPRRFHFPNGYARSAGGHTESGR